MPTLPKRLKPVLVGEQNPYGGDPRFALYPAPNGCSGHRLCCLILGMHRKAYLCAFDRANLCDGEWSMCKARQRAIELLADRAGQCKLILCGSKICSAFGVPYAPFTVADEVLLRLPHPSGRCRAWDEDRSFLKAREAVAAFAPEVAHLIGAADGI